MHTSSNSPRASSGQPPSSGGAWPRDARLTDSDPSDAAGPAGGSRAIGWSASGWIAGGPPIGRGEVLKEMRTLLARGDNVLLVGQAGVGKTLLIGTLSPSGLVVLDPLVDVNTHLAGEVRKAMDRGAQFIAATRSLDRAYLGAVRRIAWRFSTVRVPPLSGRWMRRLVMEECAQVDLRADLVTPSWIALVVRLAAGCPGIALAIVHAASEIRTARGTVPSPGVAYIEASVRRHRLMRTFHASMSQELAGHLTCVATPASHDPAARESAQPRES